MSQQPKPEPQDLESVHRYAQIWRIPEEEKHAKIVDLATMRCSIRHRSESFKHRGGKKT